MDQPLPISHKVGMSLSHRQIIHHLWGSDELNSFNYPIPTIGLTDLRC
jgi:hypothetical protein